MMTRLLTMMLMLQGISVMAQQLKPADLLF